MFTKTEQKLSTKLLSYNHMTVATNQNDETDLTEKQYTVFLVEDDPDDQDLTIHKLKTSPYIYNVHCYKSGDELIGSFVENGYYSNNLIHTVPTMIILDIHIPGTNGLDILRELKENPLTVDIPVIILTNDLSNYTALGAYKFQANAFINKPLNLDHVHEVIETGWGWPPPYNTKK